MAVTELRGARAPLTSWAGWDVDTPLLGTTSDMLLPALGRESCPWKLQTHVVSSPSGAGRMLTCSPSDCPSWRNTGGVWMGKVSSHTFPHCLGKILQGSSEMLCHHQTSGHPKNRPQLCTDDFQLPSCLQSCAPMGSLEKPRWSAEAVRRQRAGIIFTHIYTHIYTPGIIFRERKAKL